MSASPLACVLAAALLMAIKVVVVEMVNMVVEVVAVVVVVAVVGMGGVTESGRSNEGRRTSVCSGNLWRKMEIYEEGWYCGHLISITSDSVGKSSSSTISRFPCVWGCNGL